MGAQRYHNLDWLRVLGILVVFIYHAARIYDPLFWYNTFEVRNNQTSPLFSVFCFAVTFWLMPVFFLLAGASTSFSLSRRTSYQFIVERMKRLLVPFAFFLVILIPPQLYMESLQAGTCQGSFLDFLPTVFTSIGLDLSTPHVITFPQKHLWFLWYLFLMSVVTLPILRLLGGEKGKAFIQRLAVLTENSKIIFAGIVPLAVIRVVLTPTFPQYQNYADFCYWSLMYIYGFILYSDKRFEAAMVKERWNACRLGLCCYAGFLIVGWAGDFVALFEHPSHGLGSVLFQFFWCVNAWAWLVFFLGSAKAYLNASNALLNYSSEAVLPFYILHKTVILVIAFSMAAMPINLYVKFVLLLIAAFVATMILYEFVVKRVTVLRFLVGLPAVKKTEPAALRVSQAESR